MDTFLGSNEPLGISVIRTPPNCGSTRITRISRRNTDKFLFVPLLAIFLASLTFLAGCRPPQVSQADITVNIEADCAMQPVSVPAGSTVQQVIAAAGITLGNLDRLEPPGYTVLSWGDSVRVQRVREEFDTQQVIIPYEHQELRNESLPEG